ncbi:hypothetical protein [uncultured Psychrobacter sp.]|nr:hypothetical protein [uncultured Psychrobacter sp.]
MSSLAQTGAVILLTTMAMRAVAGGSCSFRANASGHLGSHASG